jgi:hypothetical protein
MTDKPQAPLIDLDTLIARPRITIDGTYYDILSPDELSVIESHRFGVWGRRIEELTGETSAEAEAELQELVGTVARKICVGVPEDVFAKLPGTQRWAIIDVFTGLLLQTRLKVAGAMTAATGELPEWMRAQIGASSSPGSSGSTADGRKTGLKRFLPFWSAPS